MRFGSQTSCGLPTCPPPAGIFHPAPTTRTQPVSLLALRADRDCKRKLLTILDRVFPEYESLFSNVFIQSSRTLLQEAVSAQEFASFDLNELTQLLHRSSHGRFGADKAEQLQAQAKQSIGVGFLADAARMELHCLLAQIELLEEQQDQVETALANLMQQIPQFITTLPGIGLATGAAILGEIGDIARFASEDKLIAYAASTPPFTRLANSRLPKLI